MNIIMVILSIIFLFLISYSFGQFWGKKFPIISLSIFYYSDKVYYIFNISTYFSPRLFFLFSFIFFKFFGDCIFVSSSILCKLSFYITLFFCFWNVSFVSRVTQYRTLIFFVSNTLYFLNYYYNGFSGISTDFFLH